MQVLMVAVQIRKFFNIKIWLLFLVMPSVLMTISGSPTYSQNITWDEAISNVSRLEDLYWKSFRDQTGHISIGTAANNADLDNHRCAISGRILGFQHLVSIFEPPLTPLVGSDPYDIGWQAASLSNWISVAETFRAKPRAYLSAFWNTQCATLDPGLPQVRGDNGMEPSFAEVSDDGETLTVLGPIEEGFAVRMAATLDRNPRVKYVSLGSPGGNLREAMQAGIFIRQRGLNTTIYADCHSACPFVFMGGIERTIWDSTIKVGFHQPYSEFGPAPFSDNIYAEMRLHLSLLGANSAEVLTWVRLASPNDMFYPSISALCASNVATFIYHGCIGGR